MKKLLTSVCYHFLLAWLILIMGIAVHVLSVMAATPIPRTIITFYDSRKEESIYWNRAQIMAAMPLNHLGLMIEQYDIAKGLPEIANRNDVRGVLTWFADGTTLDDPNQFIRWASETIDAGKQLVILGDPGFLQDTKGKETPLTMVNGLLTKIGIQLSGDWITPTYQYSVIEQDNSMVGFEHHYDVLKPTFPMISPVDKTTKSYLVIGKKEEAASYSHLVTIAKHGGYAASGYEYYAPENDSSGNTRQWYINPFEFFRLAFGTDDLPKPDTTTLAGRRIYYSHIDGDGWNNVSLIEAYRDKHLFSSQVVMENAIIPYPDLPVTVSAIAGDLDPEWFGLAEGQEIARNIFSLPNVEVSSHTYSHPFDWGFFEDGNAEKEKPFLRYYTGKVWDQAQEMKHIVAILTKDTSKGNDHAHLLDEGYTVPRAYAVKPFAIDTEISGSLNTIKRFLPAGKTINLIQWSGNTQVFEQALAGSRQAGVRNINGGDSRFDPEYPSRTWLSPIGVKVGKEWQIYSSNSNENTYTQLWTERFHGFRYLRKTVDNTESPMRLKPFNIYYHMYSGERNASLRALLMNLNYARKQEIAPITASHYAAIGDGFFSTSIVALGNNSWQVQDRGALTTIRFDHATGNNVDFSRSVGVIGQRLFQGSLYIYLDDSVVSPVISFGPAKDTQTSLLQSRWHITGFKPEKESFAFHAQGFGAGEMIWNVAQPGKYEVTLPGLPKEVIETKGNSLTLQLPMVAIEGVDVKVRYIEDQASSLRAGGEAIQLSRVCGGILNISRPRRSSWIASPPARNDASGVFAEISIGAV